MAYLKRNRYTLSFDFLEFAELIVYLILAFFLVYYTGAKLSRLVFLIVLPVVFYSRRDYFWLVFFFTLIEMPGGLFSGGGKNDVMRLPIYTLASGISFSIQELYILVLLLKSLFKLRIRNNQHDFFFKKELNVLVYYLFILILFSMLMGMSFDSVSQTFKTVLSLTLIYSLLRIINNIEDIVSFLRLLFPFAFLSLGLQAFELANSHQLISILKTGASSIQGSYSTTEPGGWIRPIEMGHAIFITFTGSLWLLVYQKHNFNRYYLILVNIISFLVIFLSGTRSWIIAFAAGYGIFIFLAEIRSSVIIRSIIVIAIVVLLINNLPVIHNQFLNAFSRVKTVEAVAQGDITGGGTISRYDVKAPGVMKAFWSSSIILGAGFSDLYYAYSNGHIGYHNILLNAGIVGLFLFLLIIGKLLSYPFKICRKFQGQNKSMLKVSVIPLIILLIINTGTQTIGYTPLGINRVILMYYSIFLIGLSARLYFSGSNIPSKE